MAIFDSPKMADLRARFAGQQRARWPWPLHVDQSPRMAFERARLEESIRHFSPEKQKFLSTRFCKADHGHWQGAWFEMRLNAWLRSLGEVYLEPTTASSYPDFRLVVGDTTVVIEATAYCGPESEYLREVHHDVIMADLESIRRPVALHASVSETGTETPFAEELTETVTNWLDGGSSNDFVFRDSLGNVIRLERWYQTSMNHVGVIMTGPVRSISGAPLRNPVRKKIQQRASFGVGNVPYVVAIYIGRRPYRAEEIVSAWFGNTILVWDDATDGIVEVRTDKTGVRSVEGRERVSSVSGILAFDFPFGIATDTAPLNAVYIQNPYADVPLPVDFFPSQRVWRVVEKYEKEFQMDWDPPERKNE